MKLRAAVFFGSLAFFFAAPNARADSGLCREGHMVETGARMYEVLVNCGAPSWSRRFNRGTEEWVYDFDEGSFPRLLRFQGGVLVQIVVLSRAW